LVARKSKAKKCKAKQRHNRKKQQEKRIQINYVHAVLRDVPVLGSFHSGFLERTLRYRERALHTRCRTWIAVEGRRTQDEEEPNPGPKFRMRPLHAVRRELTAIHLGELCSLVGGWLWYWISAKWNTDTDHGQYGCYRAEMGVITVSVWFTGQEDSINQMFRGEGTSLWLKVDERSNKCCKRS